MTRGASTLASGNLGREDPASGALAEPVRICEGKSTGRRNGCLRRNADNQA